MYGIQIDYGTLSKSEWEWLADYEYPGIWPKTGLKYISLDISKLLLFVSWNSLKEKNNELETCN